MILKLITAPADEPVGLAEVKAHLRVDTGDDDVLIQSLITAARLEAEKITRRALITQTWDLVLDAFPTVIKLPLPTLQTVVSIKYLDTAGAQQELLNTKYVVDADSEPARVTPAYGLVWPSTYPQVAAVRVQFTSGYGDTQEDIPQAIKQWLMIRVATLYEQRESVSPVQMTAVPFVDGLLEHYRVFM
jgi:uncharacterized phiE125 gp8 family phage protein